MHVNVNERTEFFFGLVEMDGFGFADEFVDGSAPLRAFNTPRHVGF
jgi:hypothetical protein